MDTLRTFIAVELPKAVTHRAGQLIDRLNVTSAKVKWVEPHNMHLTLKFLGDVNTRMIPDVCQAVSTAAEPLEPFDLQCCGAGAFPSSQRPRTVWLGAGDGEENVLELHDKIEAIRGYAKASGESRERVNDIAEAKVKAEWHGGRVLAEIDRAAGPGRGKKNCHADESFSQAVAIAGISES